ncbi:MAG TPA: CARDB domain-containing protein [Methanomassiliicoccales archaeon]|nr:CARDB domain-containing protein [Methanomassiliicoccales archaeon]
MSINLPTSVNDLKVMGTSVLELVDKVMTIQGNIIVEDEGYLALVGTQLNMRQDPNQTTSITVRDNGTLVFDEGTLTSNLQLIVYLFDNGRLYLNDSTLGSDVTVIMDDSSMIYAEETSVMGDIRAPSSSEGTLVALNTTFYSAWSYFGGDAQAELTGVTIIGNPPISPMEGAVVTVYRWLLVSVYDGTGEHTIPETIVEVRKINTDGNYGNLVSSGITDDNGTLRVRVLSAIVTSAGFIPNLGYGLNATYWYGPTNYESTIVLTQVPYPDLNGALDGDDVEVRLDIPDAKPDIDLPFTVSDQSPSRGEQVTLTAVINNIGVVTAYDILVRFEDNSTGGKILIADRVIDELAPESNVTVSVTWTASYPLGNHTLSVTVDPLNEIPELNEDNNYNSTDVTVIGVPDLAINSTDITIDPSSPVRNKSASISANIRNIGDNATTEFWVIFKDNGVEFDRFNISNLPAGQMNTALGDWLPNTPGIHTITVEVDGDHEVNESNENNNVATKSVNVLDYPDLVASSVSFMVGGLATNSAYIGEEVTLKATIFNVGESVAEQFDVAFWLNDAEIIGVVRVDTLSVGASKTISMVWVAEIVSGQGIYQNNTITVIVNPPTDSMFDHMNEMDDDVNDNNRASQVLQVIDNRPDMALKNVLIQSVGANVTSGVIGEKITILFDVENVGIIDATNVKVEVYLRNETLDILLYSQVRNFEVGEILQYSTNWVINATSGNYSLVIMVDAGDESESDNNLIDLDFTIAVPNPIITINLGGKTDYAPGSSIFVQGTVLQTGNNAPLIGQVVKVKIIDSNGFTLINEVSTTTNDNGQFAIHIPVPTGKEGQQTLHVTVETIEGEFSQETNIDIIAPFAPETIPTWVYLLIIAIVISVIVIFSLYLYRVGLGRMVECGNCGALIPDASKHCPKCGVEFEVDTAKCSECGAWISSKSESCPECGAKFMTEPIEVGQAPGYIEAMRKQYDEYIDGFREQAKAALGNKYSEEKFMEWLRTEPNYLPFEEWLRKEEMNRRSGVFPCPSCGTLNPRDSKICNRCGTVFEQKAAEEAPIEEKKSPFRRIVRRSGETKKQPKEESVESMTEQSTKEEEGENKTE